MADTRREAKTSNSRRQSRHVVFDIAEGDSVNDILTKASSAISALDLTEDGAGEAQRILPSTFIRPDVIKEPVYTDEQGIEITPDEAKKSGRAWLKGFRVAGAVGGCGVFIAICTVAGAVGGGALGILGGPACGVSIPTGILLGAAAGGSFAAIVTVSAVAGGAFVVGIMKKNRETQEIAERVAKESNRANEAAREAERKCGEANLNAELASRSAEQTREIVTEALANCEKAKQDALQLASALNAANERLAVQQQLMLLHMEPAKARRRGAGRPSKKRTQLRVNRRPAGAAVAAKP